MEIIGGEHLQTPFDDGELYDVLFGSFEFDRDFYLELARSAGGPVLEVACGTGRILVPALQAGVDIEGLDLFAPKLEVARRKAAKQGFHPALYQADMCRFQLPRHYALIYIAFNGFVLRVAGFSRWEIWGGFDCRLLEQETDLMIVFAWK